MAIIYLSGPMTGLPEKNHPTFLKWAKHFRDRGHQVINPAENDGGSTNKPWSFYMELDISSLLVCDTVVLLPGWEYSTGARLEIAIAQAIDRKIYILDDFLKVRPKTIQPKIQVLITQ